VRCRQKIALGCGGSVLLLAVAAGNAPGKPGEGIQAGGDVVVRPFADVAFSYDNNPLLLPKGQEVDDYFLDVSPGLNVIRAGDVLRVEGLFWGRFRRFEALGGEDANDWSEELHFGFGRREDWRLELHERFGRVSDYDLSVRTMDVAAEGPGDRYLERPEATPLSVMERSERVEREILDCGAGVGGPLTEKMSLNMVCDYGRIDYQPADLLDSTELLASAKAARKVTDKSSAFVVCDYILMENDSLPNPANYYAARAGWRWRGTFKSRIEASAGYSGFSVDDPGVDGSLDRDGFSYDLAWFWQVWPKVSMTLGGRSEMQLAADTAQDAKLVNLITSTAQYAVTRRLALALLFGYRHEDFSRAEDDAAGGAPVNRVAEQLHGRLRGDVVVFRWLTAYGEMWYEDTQDNVRGDYTEMRASLGVKAEY
jgi:hypothetical protein